MSPDVKKWLKDGGFLHHCFISYPHTGGTEMPVFAERVRAGILSELSTRVSGASVYFDTRIIQPGHLWPEDLRINLCASVAMVALLCPVYVEPEHQWCAREWSAMQQLGATRLRDSTLTGIIPVTFRETVLPSSANQIQPIDLSRVASISRRYHTTNEFHLAIQKIVKEIETIADQIHHNRCIVDLKNFDFPVCNPFIRSEIPPIPLGGH